jgi:8-oxo-dGTP pyrophosphatase MutT (NUDIX family)
MAPGARKFASHKTTGVQYGALPWRQQGTGIEILLITSRRTRRWIIPKGWPMKGCKPTDCAAREAEEEAGISGEISKTAIGHFRYMKLLRDGVELPCRVEVFPLKVTKEKSNWEEKDARERRWCSISEAATAVVEPQLKMMIRSYGSRLSAEKRRKTD